jgi:hypothetical protein
MKSFVLISIVTIFTGGIVCADDVLPKRPEFTRYSAMVEHSPFSLATAPVQVSTTPSWSKDLFIANAAHMSEVDMVTINSLSDKNLKEYLTTEGPNEHGYGVSSIEWSENPGATKVTIFKDGQFATLGFNEAIMSQTPSIPNAPPQNIPGIKQGVQPMGVPPALPAPHVRGLIQRKAPPITPPPNGAPLTAPES